MKPSQLNAPSAMQNLKSALKPSLRINISSAATAETSSGIITGEMKNDLRQKKPMPLLRQIEILAFPPLHGLLSFKKEPQLRG